MPALSHQAAEALGLLLGQLRLRATVTYQGQLCGRWGLDTSGAGRAGFHLVLKGRCWLRCGSDAERELVAGDLVLLPRDAPHLISGERHPAQAGVEAVWPLGADAPPGSTALVCGRFELSPGVAGPLLSALPACFVFRCGREGGDPWPRVLVERLLREATESGAASNVVIEHIVDLLFVEAIRHYVSGQPESVGLLRALADPRLARALHGLHSDLARAWTVDSMAEMAGMSRSAFAESFRSLLGETPMRYLARWRVHVAAVWLTESDATVLEVALRVGYQTEAAFSRAFKRELGTTPGVRTEFRNGLKPARRSAVSNGVMAATHEGAPESTPEDGSLDFSGLRALFLNCTLKRAPELSHTQGLIDVSSAILRKNGVEVEVLRPVDHEIAPGVYPDMTKRGWERDDWPTIHEKVMAAHMLVVATPIWLGDKSSICTKVIERLYGGSGELNEKGQYAYYGRVGGCLVTGNEDGAKHCAMNILYSLQHLGYVIPPQADAAWVGEAGPGPSYLDEGSGGPQNDFTQRNVTFMTWNLMHMARSLRDQGGIPARGNQRSKWEAGCRFDHPNPDYR